MLSSVFAVSFLDDTSADLVSCSSSFGLNSSINDVSFVGVGVGLGVVGVRDKGVGDGEGEGEGD